MGKRNCIGVLYSYDSNWIGGAYYIQNLIAALRGLPVDEQPTLKIICRRPEDFESVRKLNYPHANIFTLKYNILKRVINKISAVVTGVGVVDHYYLGDVKAIFPATFLLSFPSYFAKKINAFPIRKMFWIPDFQERYYPAFFEESDIERRNNLYKSIAASKDILILSSYAALDDFKKFYPRYTCKTHVLHFAVTHPALDFNHFQQVEKKYGLPAKYFFVPNQFWKHKNHMTLLEALKKLKEEGTLVNVVFSGKESDYRNPDYFQSVKKYVSDHQLTDLCLFLGFIPREDQLLIMKHAFCVIQPSLFEGWSTVVEDAKSLNVQVIASDIETHREQLGEKGCFFVPTDVDGLIDKIEFLESSTVKRTGSNGYAQNVVKFASDFLDVLKD